MLFGHVEAVQSSNLGGVQRVKWEETTIKANDISSIIENSNRNLRKFPRLIQTEACGAPPIPTPSPPARAPVVVC